MIDRFDFFVVPFGQRFIQQLPEGQRIRKFTDIQKSNDLCNRQLQTVDRTAVKADKKTDFDKPYQRKDQSRNCTDQKVVKTVSCSRNDTPNV